MAVKSNIKSSIGNDERAESDIWQYLNSQKINGVVLSGNKTSTQLGLAPEGYGDDSIWSVQLRRNVTSTLTQLILEGKDKDGTIKSQTVVPLENNQYINATLDNTTKKITLTKRDNTTTELDFNDIFNLYVLKTTKVGSHDLEDDITVEELDYDLKDYTTTLTNKTIDCDSNTLSNIETDNFKTGVIQTTIDESASSDEKLPTEKAVVDYTKLKSVKTAEFTYSTNTKGGYKEKIVLKNEAGTEICNAEDNGEWVDIDTAQTLKNKTIDAKDNILTFQESITSSARSGFYDKDTTKLYYKDKDGAEQCLNPDYKINDLLIPPYQTNSKQIITDDTLTTTNDSDNVKLVVTHPARVMTYADYQALTTKDANTIYVITDYPSEDITETRTMVNNRWVITRTSSTLPLLTFIYNEVVHNKKVYYTKSELNTLLDYKEDILNGAGSTIAHDDLTANMILVSDANGKVSASIYPTSTLEAIGLTFTPTIITSAYANQYVQNVSCVGYVQNKTNNVYRFDMCFDIDSVCPSWNLGGFCTLIMPTGYEFNYDVNHVKGFTGTACRVTSASNYEWQNMIFKYNTTTQMQVILPNTTLLSVLGRVHLSVFVF